MSRFWPATPTLEGEDAEALLRSLEKTCSREEWERRVARAKERIAYLSTPVTERDGSPGKGGAR